MNADVEGSTNTIGLIRGLVLTLIVTASTSDSDDSDVTVVERSDS